MGFGDCAAVCPENAICIENGIAHIDPRKCIGCGICVRNCPRGLISLTDAVDTVVVTCSNTEKGAVVRGKCSNGCIGCKKCEKTCPNGAIKVENNLARIDYEKCIACGACADACPTGAIKFKK
jgi:Fe-S-cluster-containing hydrogenase component 2